MSSAMPVVVSFISQKGGVGKSSLARALAAVAGHAGVRVLLADLDPQQSTVRRWNQRRAETKVTPPIEVRSFAKMSDALEASEGFDLLIVDTPGSVTRATLDIARHSHLVVQPSGPSIDDLDPAVLAFHELTQAGIPRQRLLLALCRTLNRQEEDEARSYLSEAGYQVLKASIPERSGYRMAQNRGQALTETREKALNARADLLLAELLGKVDAAIAAMAPARSSNKKSKGEGAA